MLFNSYVFLFGFLPLTLLGYYLIAARNAVLLGSRAAIIWLFLASLAFYVWWEPRYLALILGSMIVNFAIGHHLLGRPGLPDHMRRLIAAIGIIGNLALLGFYKYVDFFIANANALSGSQWSLMSIVLPLGISFFTFEQISYLVDSYRRITKNDDFFRYGLFVAFFPHLIAGPIVRQVEIVEQFEPAAAQGFNAANMAEGLTIFSIGLFKKAVLADGIAVYSSPVFAAAADPTTTLTLFEGWVGALGYTLQIYFDFSGYSDMAIGLARMMNIRLPVNFDSPYKAESITDFWRRWHMSLSRFLRDYLYIGLGGNRRGTARRYFNLALTMVLGGLWHGAAWTFVAWGALHGVYLVINHAWTAMSRRILPGALLSSAPYRLAAWALTLLAVIIAWVFFRASDFTSALRLLHAMAGQNGAALPSYYAAELGSKAAYLSSLGVSFASAPYFTWQAPVWIMALAAIALLLPNSQDWLRRFNIALDDARRRPAGRSWMSALEWRPNGWFGAAIGLLAAIGVLGISSTSEFLYFQF